ncbi:MAG: hypothetical protein HC869_18540, partial [Rhodospirillales bacterium]|nr:hypothetical protein [Rhodospirillales bacterium]
MNILVVYSRRIGDEAALSRATVLARLNGARLTALEVIERVPSNVTALLGSSIVEERELENRFFNERHAHLDRLVASVRQEGV